ncbi:MAG: hypothetical protein NDI62_00065 [Burkholderiales bacterium]|nr:hypothetical protein [Burkholderiales bacterium]
MNTDFKKILKISSLSALLLFIVIFAFFKTKDLMFGVKIKNVNIVDGSKMTEKVIKITGTAKNAINLSLNGRQISIDQKGNFEETISLSKGYNIISIKAKDEFGNNDEKNYQLMY